jgi:hypothetical protein
MIPGDIVKRVDKASFPNGREFCIVLRVVEGKVYLKEIDNWFSASDLVVTGRAFQPGDRVKLADNGLFSNGRPVCTVKSVEGNQVEILETGGWANSRSLLPNSREVEYSEVIRLQKVISTLESTICELLAIIRQDT